jgi:hypothetical protein
MHAFVQPTHTAAYTNIIKYSFLLAAAATTTVDELNDRIILK